MKSLSNIQIVHICNTCVGVLTMFLLIGVAVNIQHFIKQGSLIAGYGNFRTFAYPATFVYMFIPIISSSTFSLILVFDFSPNYKAWVPSKTLVSAIVFFMGSIFLAAFFPTIPGADVMTDNAALACDWTNYMEWKVIYNAPLQFPWVTGMDRACRILKAADAFAWILFIGWLIQSYLYIRILSSIKTLTQ